MLKMSRQLSKETLRARLACAVPALLCAFVCVAALVAVPAKAFAADREDWMSDIDSDVKVSQLTIPGTHDAACYHTGAMTASFAECQNRDINGQLLNGVRAFDLRYSYDDGVFGLYHGDTWPFIYTCYELGGAPEESEVPTPLTLEGEFAKIQDYLNAHPGEFAVVNVQREKGDAGPAVDAALNALYAKYNVYTELVEATTVGDVRGRIVLGNSFMQGVSANGPYNRYRGTVEQKVADLKTVFSDAPYTSKGAAVQQKVIYVNLSWRSDFEAFTKGPKDYAQDVYAQFFAVNPFQVYNVDGNRAYGVILYDFPTNQIIDWTIDANDWAQA